MINQELFNKLKNNILLSAGQASQAETINLINEIEAIHASLVSDNKELSHSLDIALKNLDDKDIQKTLIEVENRFSMLMQQSPSVIEIYNLDGLQISVNNAYEKLWGIPAENTVNSFNVLKSQEVKDSGLIEYVNRAYAGEVVSVPEYSFDSRGETEGKGLGRVRWLSTKIYPLKDFSGKVTNIVITHEDITDRKEAGQKVLEEKNKAQQYLNIAEVMLLTIDEYGIVTMINAKGCKILEASESEIVGKNWIDNFIPVAIQDELRDVCKQIYKGEIALVRDYENEIITKKGNKKLISWHTAEIKDADGKIIGFLSSGVDITKTKQIEQELIQAKEKAEENDALKSAFLANMSHEIRTPMNGILGFASLLKEPMLSGQEQQNYIAIIEKAGKRMLNIINDIISIAKVESGQMELHFSDVNVHQCLQDIYLFFQQEVKEKGIDFILQNTSSKEEFIIKTDLDKFSAVLANLVKNAIKFTEKGSIELGYKIKDNYLEFFVKDTGAGIAPEKMEIVFERFRQGSELITRNYEGAGLGLAISKAYVEMLGGEFWVESVYREGSVFYFTIPFLLKNNLTNNSSDVVTSSEQFSIGKKLKILIAEDDFVSAEYLSIKVKKLAEEIIKVKTGEEALQVCIDNPDIDLIFMDIKLPKIDGYEVTRKIREFNKDVCIIAQTAFGLIDDRAKAIEAGCNDYISKPIDSELLFEIISKSYFANN